MIKILTQHGDRAQIALINQGKSKTKHVKLDKKSGKWMDSKGIPYPVKSANQ